MAWIQRDCLQKSSVFLSFSPSVSPLQFLPSIPSSLQWTNPSLVPQPKCWPISMFRRPKVCLKSSFVRPRRNMAPMVRISIPSTLFVPSGLMPVPFLSSSPRGPVHSTVAACSRTVQGPASPHPSRFRGDFLHPRSIRGRR